MLGEGEQLDVLFWVQMRGAALHGARHAEVMCRVGYRAICILGGQRWHSIKVFSHINF